MLLCVRMCVCCVYNNRTKNHGIFIFKYGIKKTVSLYKVKKEESTRQKKCYPSWCEPPLYFYHQLTPLLLILILLLLLFSFTFLHIDIARVPLLFRGQTLELTGFFFMTGQYTEKSPHLFFFSFFFLLLCDFKRYPHTNSHKIVLDRKRKENDWRKRCYQVVGWAHLLKRRRRRRNETNKWERPARVLMLDLLSEARRGKAKRKGRAFYMRVCAVSDLGQDSIRQNGLDKIDTLTESEPIERMNNIFEKRIWRAECRNRRGERERRARQAGRPWREWTSFNVRYSKDITVYKRCRMRSWHGPALFYLPFPSLLVSFFLTFLLNSQIGTGRQRITPQQQQQQQRGNASCVLPV